MGTARIIQVSVRLNLTSCMLVSSSADINMSVVPAERDYRPKTINQSASIPVTLVSSGIETLNHLFPFEMQ